MFTNLLDFDEEKIWSGTILRICLSEKSEFYYTDKVFDLMVFENYTEVMGLGAVIINGYKAGKISFFFPKDAYYDMSLYSVSTKWLQQNLLAIWILSQIKQIYLFWKVRTYCLLVTKEFVETHS